MVYVNYFDSSKVAKCYTSHGLNLNSREKYVTPEKVKQISLVLEQKQLFSITDEIKFVVLKLKPCVFVAHQS